MSFRVPIVSVVITAHNRKDYLSDAVNSVLEQDADRNVYEIIVVKNFHDGAIDSFLEQSGVRSIFTDEQSFGAKLSLGIESSFGEVIAFLDDDDKFSRDKITSLIGVFKDELIVYHHSSIKTIDDNGKEYDRGLIRNIPRTLRVGREITGKMKIIMRYKLDWYMSAISCRKSAILEYLHVIKNAPASLDKIMFLVCVEAEKYFFFDSRPLTKYRVHESLTTRITDREHFLNTRKEFYRRSLRALIESTDSFKSQAVKKIIKLETIHGELLLYFFSDDPDDIISLSFAIKNAIYSLVKGLRPITVWSLSDILRIIFPAFIRSSYYKRATNEFKRYSSH